MQGSDFGKLMEETLVEDESCQARSRNVSQYATSGPCFSITPAARNNHVLEDAQQCPPTPCQTASTNIFRCPEPNAQPVSKCQPRSRLGEFLGTLLEIVSFASL